MKQSKILGIVITVVNMILIVICAVFYLRADKTAPEFVFQAADIVYEEGMDSGMLTAGITAYDNDDGDVTDRIVIEKMIENRQENSLIVFFAVSDKSGNVAKASKMFKALWKEEESKHIDDDVTANQLMEAGIQADLRKEDGETGEENETLPMASPTASPTPEPSPSPTAAPVPTEAPAAAQPQQQEASQAESQSGGAPAAEENSEAPVLILNTSEVKTRAGSAPAWVNVISTLRDDKDSYETLFHNLSVSKYDKNRAGTYQVTVSTEDSDGNKSNAVPLTIIVD